MIPSAVMTQTQPAPSVHNSASENADPADNPVVARLQQAVDRSPADLDCDAPARGATAAPHTRDTRLGHSRGMTTAPGAANVGNAAIRK
jgi:hypothetical protein